MTRLLALTGVFTISFSAIFVRLAEVSPSTSALFRTAYALPVLMLLALLARDGARSSRAHALAFGSGLVFSLNLLLWHRTIDLIGAGLSTVLGNTQVVFIGLVAWLLYRERPSRLAFGLMPLMGLGVLLISGLGRADAYGRDPSLGVVLGLLTGVASAGYVMSLRAANRAGSGGVIGPLLDATLGATFGSLLLGLLSDPGFSLTPSWPAHGWLLALALGSQVVGWLLISRALARLPALETAVMLLMQPILTVLWGFLLFAERLSGWQWLGVAAVLGGVALLSVFGSTAPQAGARSRRGPAKAQGR